jgi:hypothetical protein
MCITGPPRDASGGAPLRRFYCSRGILPPPKVQVVGARCTAGIGEPYKEHPLGFRILRPVRIPDPFEGSDATTGTLKVAYPNHDIYDGLRVQPQYRRATHVFDGLYMRTDGGFDTRTFECKEGGPPVSVRDDEYRLHHKATVPLLGCLAPILPTLRLLTTPRTIIPKFRGGSRAEGAG